MKRELVLAVCVALGSGCGGGDQGQDDGPRSAMGEIARSLHTLLSLGLRPEVFADEANRAMISGALAELAAGGATLESHTASQEPAFAHLGARLATDTREAQRRFDDGRADEARFLLGDLARNCIACHSRLPSDSSELAEELFSDVEPAELSPLQRIRLEIATRQFDLALDSCEALFTSDAVSAAELDLDGVLLEYLLVALRVKNDPARARKGLERVAARSDVPEVLAKYLGAWIATLNDLAKREPLDDGLSEGLVLLREAQEQREDPSDRSVLVQAVAASGWFHRFLATGPEKKRKAAEAYYLLAMAERMIGRSVLSEVEFYLETCIRTQPHSPIAIQAYGMLEEEVRRDHEGAGGANIPPERKTHLDAMRALATGTG